MSLLKRFEVWLLLLLSLGAAFWVLTRGQPAGEYLNAEAIAADAPAEPALVIRRCTLERDYGNARLDLELRYRNASPRPLILEPPDVRLLDAGGQEVPLFVLPAEKPPQVPAQTAQDVRLRYWLDTQQLQGRLTLEIRGARAEVKGAAPFALDRLENRKPQSWTGPIP